MSCRSYPFVWCHSQTNEFSHLNISPSYLYRHMALKNLKLIIVALSVTLVSCQGNSQNRISINIPTAASEAEYVWHTMQDIRFFDENGYQVSLPEGPLIQELLDKARAESLEDADYERLKAFVEDSVYNEADYQKGFEKIEHELELINTMVNEIDATNYAWDFNIFDTYQVNLTLYGPGGSYDPEEGSLLIFTTVEGKFKQHDNPAYTIIHEITHIGIEDGIISKYDVPHALKERIVDTFVLLNFGQYLPEYRIQDMGDVRTDQYLKEKSDLANLSDFVAMIMKEGE